MWLLDVVFEITRKKMERFPLLSAKKAVLSGEHDNRFHLFPTGKSQFVHSFKETEEAEVILTHH